MTPHLYKYKKDCDEDNQQKPFDCVNNFMQAKTGCDTTRLLETCNSSQDLNHYFKVAKEVADGVKDNELEEFGCMQKNCDFYYWIPENKCPFDNLSLISIYDSTVRSI